MEKTDKYELTLLVQTEEDIKKVTSEVEDLVKKHEGKIANVDTWGKRSLSYPIKKQMEANFVLLEIDVDKEQLRSLEKGLKIKNALLRYMVVKKNF